MLYFDHVHIYNYARLHCHKYMYICMDSFHTMALMPVISAQANDEREQQHAGNCRGSLLCKPR